MGISSYWIILNREFSYQRSAIMIVSALSSSSRSTSSQIDSRQIIFSDRPAAAPKNAAPVLVG
jgi:hypothetical protein